MRGAKLAIGLTLALGLAAIGRLDDPAAALAAHPHAKLHEAAERQPAPQPYVHRRLALGRGESLDLLLAYAGISPNQRQSVERALRRRYDPRRLRVGTPIGLTLHRESTAALRLISLNIDVSRNADITLVARHDGSFDPTRPETAGSDAAVARLRSISGRAGRDFPAALRAAGLPASLVHEVREALVYDPDLPAKPPAQARFTVDFRGGGGRRTGDGHDVLQRVALTIGGRTHSVFRYSVAAGLVAFVSPNGRGILRARLGTPVVHARVSSPWGWRIHPVLDRPEFHKGIDLAAPEGTPVRATAAGEVLFVGRHGNYGRLIKLQHTGELLTTYGHLQRFAKGLHVGSHVAAGQVIGYVGDTGLSTGPHLYYEVYVAGKRVNPARKSLAVPIRLAGVKLHRFRRMVMADTQTAAR